jgi:hypothetical protein
VATLGVFLIPLAIDGLRYRDSVCPSRSRSCLWGSWHIGQLTIAINGVVLFGLAALLTGMSNVEDVRVVGLRCLEEMNHASAVP